VTAGGDAGTTNPFGTGVFCCLRQTVAEYRLPVDVVAAARTTAADLRIRLARAAEPVVAAGWDRPDRA